MKKTVASILSLFMFLAFSSNLAAEEKKQESQAHFKAGLTLMKVEDFGSAAAEFEQSIKLFVTKSGLFNLANCYKALHQYGDSLATYKRLKRDYLSTMSIEMTNQTNKEMKEIISIVGHVEIVTIPEEAEILLDGEMVHRTLTVLSSGEHTIMVSLSGYEPENRTVNILSQQTTREHFELKKKSVTVVPVAPPISAPATRLEPTAKISDSAPSSNANTQSTLPSQNSSDGRPDTPGFNIFYGSVSFASSFHGWGLLLEGLDEADDDTFETKPWPGLHLSLYGITSRHTHLGAFYTFMGGEAETKLWNYSGIVDKVSIKNHMFGFSFKSGKVFGRRVGIGACMEIGMILSKHEINLSNGRTLTYDGFLKGFVMSPRMYIDVMVVKKDRFELAVSTSVGPHIMMMMASESSYDIKYFLTTLGAMLGISLGL